MTSRSIRVPPHVVRLLQIRAEGWLSRCHRFRIAATPQEPHGRLVIVAREGLRRGKVRIATRAGTLEEAPARTLAIVRFSSREATAGAELRTRGGSPLASARATRGEETVPLQTARGEGRLEPIEAWWRGARLHHAGDDEPWAQLRPATLTGRESTLAFFRDPDPLLGAFAYLLARRRWKLGEDSLQPIHERLLARARPRRV